MLAKTNNDSSLLALKMYRKLYFYLLPHSDRKKNRKWIVNASCNDATQDGDMQVTTTWQTRGWHSYMW